MSQDAYVVLQLPRLPQCFSQPQQPLTNVAGVDMAHVLQHPRYQLQGAQQHLQGVER